VLTPDISYGFYPVWNEMYDVGSVIMPLDDGFNVLTENYKGSNGVIIANPNAPTGIALSLCLIEEIVQNNPGGVVIIDEAYIDFADVKSAVALINKYGNLLVVRTFSKSHSLAGLRVGFAVGNERLIGGLIRVKNAFNSYPLDMLAQIGATAATEDISYWNEKRSCIIKTRDETAAELRALGYNVLKSQANFLFAEVRHAKELYDYLFNNKILVRYWNKPRINNYIRITIGTKTEMEAFLLCVNQFLKEKPEKQR
jgi:histidinol-phosphate aminotransferase